MKHSRLVVTLAVAGALAASFADAAREKPKAAAKPSAASLTVTSVPPPSGSWEGKPPPADGWVWSAGYHRWDGSRYVWTPGEWILARPGFEYRQRQWVQAPEGKWKLIGGDWVEREQQASR